MDGHELMKADNIDALKAKVDKFEAAELKALTDTANEKTADAKVKADLKQHAIDNMTEKAKARIEELDKYVNAFFLQGLTDYDKLDAATDEIKALNAKIEKKEID